MSNQLPKMLLHACCAPCSSSVIEQLRDEYDLTMYYYNPNIHPQKEYQIRCDEMIRWCEKCELPLIVCDYDPVSWDEQVRGLEDEPERGERCTVCYQLRMEAAARWAQQENFDVFTTVLSISPHKDADRINRLGEELEELTKVKFYSANFKKKGGFQRSLEISKEEGFYRQNYCGCRYSLAESVKRHQNKANNQS